MSKSTNMNLRIEETDAEIELTAEELSAMSEAPAAEKREARPSFTPSNAKKSATSRKLRLPLVLTAAVSVTVAIVVLATSKNVGQSASHSSDQIAQLEGPTLPEISSTPVRFANPFDADEVFEFPAGTSEIQARDAVAELLLERAMSRQKT